MAPEAQECFVCGTYVDTCFHFSFKDSKILWSGSFIKTFAKFDSRIFELLSDNSRHACETLLILLKFSLVSEIDLNLFKFSCLTDACVIIDVKLYKLQETLPRYLFKPRTFSHISCL